MKKLVLSLLGISLVLGGLVTTPAAHADFFYPSGPQTNISLSTILNGGWTPCYSQSFLDDSRLVSALPANCLTSQYVMEVGTATGGSTALLLAAGETRSVFNVTGLNATSFNNGTYWYNNPTASFGFSPSATISQTLADVCNSGTYPYACGTQDGDLRFSVHQSVGQGGWRIGKRDFLQIPQNGNYTWSIYVSGGTDGQPRVETSTPPQISRNATTITCSQGTYTLVTPTSRTSFKFDSSSVALTSGGTILASSSANTTSASWPISSLGSFKGVLTCSVTGQGSGLGVSADSTQNDAAGVQLKAKATLQEALRQASSSYAAARTSAYTAKSSALSAALAEMSAAKAALSPTSKSYISDIKAATTSYLEKATKASSNFNNALAAALGSKLKSIDAANSGYDAALETAKIALRI